MPDYRLRCRYSKLGKVRFTSHRDVVRMWERAWRRSGLTVARSEGFSPHLVMSFGLALPTGAESFAEYLDVTVTDGCEQIDDLAPSLSLVLPEGIDVSAVALVEDGVGSLQEEVSLCTWKVEVLGLAATELASRIERLLAAQSIPIERVRKGRMVSDDLRPGVLALSVGNNPGGTHRGVWLDAELATRPRGVRPRELLEGLGPDVRLSRVRRMHQWIERDGARWEPLESRGENTDVDAVITCRRRDLPHGRSGERKACEGPPGHERRRVDEAPDW